MIERGGDKESVPQRLVPLAVVFISRVDISGSNAQLCLHAVARIPCVYTDSLQLLLQPIRRHFEIRKGPDSRLARKRSFVDFRNIANAIKSKRFHENGNIGYKLILLIKNYV